MISCCDVNFELLHYNNSEKRNIFVKHNCDEIYHHTSITRCDLRSLLFVPKISMCHFWVNALSKIIQSAMAFVSNQSNENKLTEMERTNQ